MTYHNVESLKVDKPPINCRDDLSSNKQNTTKNTPGFHQQATHLTTSTHCGAVLSSFSWWPPYILRMRQAKDILKECAWTRAKSPNIRWIGLYTCIFTGKYCFTTNQGVPANYLLRLLKTCALNGNTATLW